MKDYVKFIDGLPWIVKLIFALPVIDGFIYGIYRIAKGRLIAGIVWIFLGFFLLWVVDLYCVITKGKVTLFV